MMALPRIFMILVFCFMVSTLHAATKSTGPVKRTKLCGDDDCNEILFKSKITRAMASSHPSMLTAEQDQYFDIVAIKYSDRVDIMEAKSADGTKGMIYMGAIDKGPYVEFLRNAVETKKEMKIIVQDVTNVGERKVMGVLHAEMDLVRDLNVQARTYALEQKLPAPEEYPVPEPPAKGHGHSHGGHGHSHDHGDNHGHSHDAPSPAPKAAAIPPPKVAEEEKIPVPTSTPQAAPAVTLPTPVSEVPPTTTASTPIASEEVADPDAVMAEMMKRDLELAAMNKEMGVPTGTKSAEAQEPAAQAVPEPEQADQVVLPDVRMDGGPPRLSAGDLMGGGAGSVAASAIPPAHPAEPTLPPPSPQEPVVPVVEATPDAVVSPEVQPVAEVPLPAAVPEEQQEQPTTAPVTIDVTTPAPTIPEPAVPEVEVPNVETVPVEQVPTPAPAVAEPVVTEAVPTPTPVVDLPEVTLPPLTLTPDSMVTPPPEVVPEDPKPSETPSGEGYCDGDDCSRVTPPPTPVNVVPNTVVDPVTPAPATNSPDAVPTPDDYLKAAPFEDNLSAGEGFVDMEAMNRTPSAGSESAGLIGGVVSSMTGVVRSILPLGDMSDAGVGLVLNLLFVLTALLIHIISYFLSDSGDSVHFDRRIAHDLATKCKQLQEQLKQKEEELHRVGANAGRHQGDADEIASLKLQLGPLQLECSQLRNRLTQAEAEAAREKNDREGLEATLSAEREQIKRAEERADDAVRECEASTKHLQDTTKELKDVKSALDRLEQELRAERSRADDLSSQAEQAIDEARSKDSELAASKSTVHKLSDSVRQLESELKAASDMLATMEQKKETDGVESGGSGGSGWSDFGDEPELEEKEKTPAVNSADVGELIRMRAAQNKLEQDLKDARVSLDQEVKEKERLEAKLTTVEKDLERKTKEAEQRDAERMGADERANKLLSIIDGNNSKIRDVELTCDKLRDEVARCQAELVSVQDEKRKKEERVKELDADLKKLRHDFNRLETKSFHDVMEWKKKFEAAQLAQSIALNSSSGFDMLNMSSGSADRENAPSRGIPFESLWDEPSHRAPPLNRNRTMSPDDEFMSGTMPVVKKTARSRRSDRMVREPSPSDAEKRKEKKEGVVPRRRSRSHGRQMYMGGPNMGGPMGPMPSYMQGGPPGYPPMYHDPSMSFGEPLNRRHSKSGHVYYSSGGSNGGRSPPPEMPLISAQPPPGTRRPSSKRATDLGADFRSS